jgi:hypothetical protein
MKRPIRAFAAWALLPVLIGLSACSGGSGGPFIGTPLPKAPQTSQPPQLSTTSISFSSGSAQSFTVSEPGYTGTFTATVADSAVATVAVASASSTATRHRDAGAAQSVTGSGSFTVTPVGGGSTTITVSDQNGQSVTVGISVTSATLVTY